jgi:SAM-dependent methyltransferase
MEVAQIDVDHLVEIRSNVRRLLEHAADRYVRPPGRALDVAPQDHEGARPFFPEGVAVETLDIDPASGADHIADLCATNSNIAGASFDYVVCTEVLEHTRQPFAAVAEIRRLLRPGGLVFVSSPFNFRIHGPLPDCWRFTEHGLRSLFNTFDILELNDVATPGRDLMPIHYTVVAQKPVG